MRTTTLAISGALLLLAATGLRDADAGERIEIAVSVSIDRAWGTFGGARNSASTLERVQCGTTSSRTSAQGSCFFRTASGATATCWTTNPSLIAAIHAIGTDDNVGIIFNKGTGECTFIDVFTDSAVAPKAL